MTYTVFIHDDTAYQQWLAANPKGYVLNSFHERGDEDMVLHRANCTHVADHSVPHQGKTYTGGPRIKVCAPDVASLKEYVVSTKPLMATIEVCRTCVPVDAPINLT